MIEKLFDVMQGDGAEQLSFFPDYVNMLQPMLHKCLSNLSEGSIAQKRHRVASNEICDFRFGQLLFEERRAFAFEGFSVDELLFENATQ